MTPQEAAEKAEKAYQSLEYPARPEKPIKGKDESNADFGKRLDAYEWDLATWKKQVQDYREAGGRINDTFHDDLLESLGLKNHPKAEKLYYIAWDKGHSSGYGDVASEAESLAELLR